MTFEPGVSRLERNVVVWKRNTYVIATICMCIVTMGQSPTSSKEHGSLTSIKMNQLTLTDKDGNVALVISGDAKGVISINNPSTNGGTGLMVDEKATSIVVQGLSKMTTAIVCDKNQAIVGLSDQKTGEKNYRVHLLARRPGNNSPITAFIALSDKHGENVWKEPAQ